MPLVACPRSPRPIPTTSKPTHSRRKRHEQGRTDRHRPRGREQYRRDRALCDPAAHRSRGRSVGQRGGPQGGGCLRRSRLGHGGPGRRRAGGRHHRHRYRGLAVTTATDDESGPSDLAVLAPVTGRVLPLTDVPDPVFAASMVGPGLAIHPADSEIGQIVAVAPIAGIVVTLHPHAYAIQNADGASVLTHLGIDTVQMNGESFETKVSAGDVVEAGDPIVTWDPATVAASG